MRLIVTATAAILTASAGIALADNGEFADWHGRAQPPMTASASRSSVSRMDAAFRTAPTRDMSDHFLITSPDTRREPAGWQDGGAGAAGMPRLSRRAISVFPARA
jgi:hypothetical protein